MMDRETGMLSHTTRVISTFSFTILGVVLLIINGFQDNANAHHVTGGLMLPGFMCLGVAYYIHNWGSKPRNN